MAKMFEMQRTSGDTSQDGGGQVGGEVGGWAGLPLDILHDGDGDAWEDRVKVVLLKQEPAHELAHCPVGASQPRGRAARGAPTRSTGAHVMSGEGPLLPIRTRVSVPTSTS